MSPTTTIYADSAKESQIAEIRRMMTILRPNDGDVLEVRAIGVPARGKPLTAGGYFDDFDKAAEAAWFYSEKRKAAGTYMTLNQVNPALLGRSPNKMTDYLQPTTADHEIERRLWLFIDVDAKHPTGVAATDPERQAAMDLAYDVEEWLKGHDFGLPIIGSSGNGYALFYRVDLPNDEESKDLVKAVLTAINNQFSWCDPSEATGLPAAIIDTTVCNAARICRLAGTMNRKGYDMPDRPHRRASLGELPEDGLQVVSKERLAAVAALAPKDEPPGHAKPTRNGKPAADSPSYKRLDVERWLTANGVTYKVDAGSDCTRYLLRACPFNSQHGSRGETAIVQATSGKTTFSCMHNSCSGHRWSDVKAAIGPPAADHYERPSGADKGNTKKNTSSEEPPKIRLAVIDSREFAAADYRSRFLIEDILVAEEPGIIGGRYKVLKTSVAIDMALSLSMGREFLNHFPVPRAVKVLVLSGESGPSTIQRHAKTIAAEREFDLADANIVWGWQLPQIASAAHQQALCDVIQEKNIDVTFIDPAYLCLLGGDSQGRQASNLFDMGPLLLNLTGIGQLTNSTIVLIHHCRKNQIETFSVPELEDLSMSGFAEWARQWLLLGRREPFKQGSGEHRLWLNAGGSAGHSGCYALDINEGTIDQHFEGRQWEVEVGSPEAARKESARRKDVRRPEAKAAKVGEQQERLAAALGTLPRVEGETARKLRELSGLNVANFGAAILALLQNGTAVECKVRKQASDHDGYRLTDKHWEAVN